MSSVGPAAVGVSCGVVNPAASGPNCTDRNREPVRAYPCVFTTICIGIAVTLGAGLIAKAFGHVLYSDVTVEK